MVNLFKDEPFRQELKILNVQGEVKASILAPLLITLLGPILIFFTAKFLKDVY